MAPGRLSRPGDPNEGRETRREAARNVVRALVGLLVFIAALQLLSWRARSQLEAIGTWFVSHFGIAGIFAGTFVADAFSVPVPPAVYLFLAVTSRRPQSPAVVAVCAASILAGAVAFVGARSLSHWAPLRRLVAKSEHRLGPIFRDHGGKAAFVAALTPVPFSLTCYLAGIYRMRPRVFLLFLILRVPRLLVTYAAIRAGWL